MKQGKLLLFIIIFSLTGFNLPLASPQSPQCSVVNYQVQGRTGDGIFFYGVWGYARVFDPIVQPAGAYVNSDWVVADQNNIVELGWREIGSGARTYFRVWHINGVYHEDAWGAPPVESDHQFKLYNVNGDRQWRYWVDNVLRYPNITAPFSSGITGAMRERHNDCDSGWAHWWNLQRCDFACNWRAWQTLTAWDNDPVWNLRAVGTSEFYVE